MLGRVMVALGTGALLFVPSWAHSRAGSIRYEPASAASAVVARYSNYRGAPLVVELGGEPFADATTVHREVRKVAFGLSGCDGVPQHRWVSAWVERPSTDEAVVNTVLRRAALFAWRRCPITWRSGGVVRTRKLDLGGVQFVRPDGSMYLTVHGPTGDEFGQTLGADGRTRIYTYVWRDWRPPGSFHNSNFHLSALWSWLSFNGLLWTGFAAAVIFMVWRVVRKFIEVEAREREHPAARLVYRAINEGARIDGVVFQSAVNRTPRNDRERDLRTWQSHEMADDLRLHEAGLRQESADILNAERRRAEAQNALRRAQNDLLRAGLDHEAAAAATDELRNATRKP